MLPGMPQAQELLPLFRQMQLIRRLEEESARAYAQGKIGGFLHLYIGQEAAGVGSIAALKPTDYVVTTYRDHGSAQVRTREHLFTHDKQARRPVIGDSVSENYILEMLVLFREHICKERALI